MGSLWQFYLTSTVSLKVQLSVCSVKACIVLSNLANGTSPVVSEFAIPALTHVNKKNKNKWTAALTAFTFLEEVWLWPVVVLGTRCCNPVPEDNSKMETFSTGVALPFNGEFWNFTVFLVDTKIEMALPAYSGLGSGILNIPQCSKSCTAKNCPSSYTTFKWYSRWKPCSASRT